MDYIEIFKALSNDTRLNILGWLREPEKNFPPQGGSLGEPVDLKGGVCVSSIQEKAGASSIRSPITWIFYSAAVCFFPSGMGNGHIIAGTKKR